MPSQRQTRLPSRITIKDIAKRINVSISSVSYVLNNGPRPVSEEMRQRVLQAIDELGGQPGYMPRTVNLPNNHQTTQSPRRFDVILTTSRARLKRPYYSEHLMTLLDEAARHQYNLRFISSLKEIRDLDLFVSMFRRDLVAGAIVIGPELPQGEDQQLFMDIVERLGNVVCLDFHWPGLPSVLFDMQDAGKRIVDHLVGLGHKYIGFIGVRDERFESYKASMQFHNIEIESRYLSPIEVANTPDDGYRYGLQLLRQSKPPTAIFAVCDEIGIGILRAAHELGVCIPGELSVVGVDDIEMASFVTPPLTTMAVPKNTMSSQAVRTLVARSTALNDPPMKMIFQVELIERGSTGPCTG